jgi:hypothetical protein
MSCWWETLLALMFSGMGVPVSKPGDSGHQESGARGESVALPDPGRWSFQHWQALCKDGVLQRGQRTLTKALLRKFRVSVCMKFRSVGFSTFSCKGAWVVPTLARFHRSRACQNQQSLNQRLPKHPKQLLPVDYLLLLFPFPTSISLLVPNSHPLPFLSNPCSSSPFQSQNILLSHQQYRNYERGYQC